MFSLDFGQFMLISGDLKDFSIAYQSFHLHLAVKGKMSNKTLVCGKMSCTGHLSMAKNFSYTSIQ